jgi:hypothetical protein
MLTMKLVKPMFADIMFEISTIVNWVGQLDLLEINE